MLDKEDLMAISQLMTEVTSLINTRFDKLEDRMSGLEDRMSGLELHIEEHTEKNIQILDENFIEIIKKINLVVPTVSDNNMYKIKVDYLEDKVRKLEADIKELKNKTA